MLERGAFGSFSLMARTALVFGISVLVAACGASTRPGDPKSTFTPGEETDCLTSASAEPNRIACQRNPQSPTRRDPAAQPTMNVGRAVVVAIDNYDETRDGKGRGAVYVQDVSSSAPYSGVSLYRPTLLPASSTPAPGDVFELIGGKYQENTTIGTTVTFPAGQYLPQLAYATGNFAFEYVPPAPAEVTPAMLANWETGKQYIGMLVKLTNVRVSKWEDDGKGRVTGDIASGASAPAISNELMDIQGAVGSRTSFASVTGVVTYFFSLKVAPRSAADIAF